MQTYGFFLLPGFPFFFFFPLTAFTFYASPDRSPVRAEHTPVALFLIVPLFKHRRQFRAFCNYLPAGMVFEFDEISL